jgi:hypothetical protein
MPYMAPGWRGRAAAFEKAMEDLAVKALGL